jgi:divalent metal cation (Fe/Co/Zn/Cd) transporter
MPKLATLKLAVRLEALTIAWMVVEGAVSIGAGVAAGSLVLVAFGADSAIELISGCLLYWRLSREARAVPDDAGSFEAIDRRMAKIGGYLLYALAVYVLVQGIYGLVTGHSAESSVLGIAVTVLAALGMPAVARAKLGLAAEIGSPALRADAIESLTCGYLAVVALAGLVANAALRWWWLDSAGALVFVPFLIKEGREAIRGECSCHSD